MFYSLYESRRSALKRLLQEACQTTRKVGLSKAKDAAPYVSEGVRLGTFLESLVVEFVEQDSREWRGTILDTSKRKNVYRSSRITQLVVEFVE